MQIFNGPEGMEEPTAGNKKGQALVEYAFTLLLVTLVVILMVKAFGQSTNNMYNTISSSVKNAVG
jgi:Flp pilus assembly pilin Flp